MRLSNMKLIKEREKVINKDKVLQIIIVSKKIIIQLLEINNHNH